MKKKISILMIIICVMGVFNGCTSGNKKDDNTPAIDTPSNKKLSDLEILKKYMAILGDSDNAVISVFGDGIKTVDEDTNITVLRRYSLNLFGEALSMILFLENGSVMDMSITPPSGTYEDWFHKITGLLGKPDETIEAYKNQSQEIRASAWNLYGGSFTLQSACGTVLLKLNGRGK